MTEFEGRATRSAKRRRKASPDPSPEEKEDKPQQHAVDESQQLKPRPQRMTSVKAPNSRRRSAAVRRTPTPPQSLRSPSFSPLTPQGRPDDSDQTLDEAQGEEMAAQDEDKEAVKAQIEEEALEYRTEEQHELSPTEPPLKPEPVIEQYETPPELDPDRTPVNEPDSAVLPSFHQQSSFRMCFSESARRNSRDLRPSRSRSPPPYSSISSPIATPEPPSRVKEAKYRPYQQTLVLRGHKRGVSCVRFSPSGKLIASCSADATIRIWSATTGKHINTLEGHLAGVSTLSWSSDSKTLASGSDDKCIRLWDVATGKAHPHPLIGHHNYIYSLAFNPKGNILVSGSYDEAVYIWDVRTRRVLRSLPAHSDPVGGVDVIRDGTLIASCATDGLIRIWDTGTGQCLRTLVHEDNAGVTSVRFSPNGRYVLAWTLDGCVRLWDYVEGRCVKTYQGHANGKYSIAGAFGVYGGDDDDEVEGGGGRTGGPRAPEKAFVVSGSEDGAILAWDVVQKTILQRIDNAHGGCVLGVDTWNGDSSAGERRMMVSCGLDKTVRIWQPVESVAAAAAAAAAAVAESEAVLGDEQVPSEEEAGVKDADMALDDAEHEHSTHADANGVDTVHNGPNGMEGVETTDTAPAAAPKVTVNWVLEVPT